MPLFGCNPPERECSKNIMQHSGDDWMGNTLPIKSKHADKSSKLEKVMHHTASQGQCLSLAGNPTPPTIRCVCKRLVYICISKLCPSWARSSLTKALYGLEKLIEFLVDDKEEALMCTFTFTSDRVPHACSNLNNSLGLCRCVAWN